MLYFLGFSEAVYPSVMLITTVIGLFIQYKMFSANMKSFRDNEMAKKADKSYVDMKILDMKENTDLKIKNVTDSHEETKAILERIDERLEYVYKKHMK